MIKSMNIEKTSYQFIIIMMIALPFFKLLSYCLLLGGIIDNSFDVNQVYVLWISVPILITFYLYGLYTKRFKLNIMDFLTFGLIIFAFISTIFAKDVSLSIFGEERRNEGLLTLLNYYFLFLNLSFLTTSSS